MKKAFLILSLILILVVAFAACDGGETPNGPNDLEHTHAYGEWETTKEASCLEEGMRIRRCACLEQESETIPATGHAFGEWTTTQELTCTADGTKERICSCGEKESETIPSVGHTFGEWKTTKEVTCLVDGTKERVCFCGENETETITAAGAHSFSEWAVIQDPTCTVKGLKLRACVCGEKETETVAAIGHTFGEWKTTKEVTCLVDGTKERVCFCGESETEAILAVGHHTFAEWSIAKDPSCTVDGVKIRVCSCGANETELIPAPGHIFGEWVVTQEPTDTVSGVKERSCACGEKETGNLAPLGCTFGEWVVVREPSCTLEGLKERLCACGEKETETVSKLNHTFDQWVVIQEPACMVYGLKQRACVCGEKNYDAIETIPAPGHSYGAWIVDTAATCVETGTRHHICTECGNTENDTIPVNALAHNYATAWTTDNTHHWRKCQNSGCTSVTGKTGHAFGEWVVDTAATCMRTGTRHHVCAICQKSVSETYSDPNAHNYATAWTSDNTNHWRKCQNIGCSSVTGKTGHTFGEWVVDATATCMKTGTRHHVCAICQKSLSETYSDPNAHNYATTWTSDNAHHWHKCQNSGCTSVSEKTTHAFGEWIVDKAATCVSTGTRHHACTVCNKSLSETIPVNPLPIIMPPLGWRMQPTIGTSAKTVVAPQCRIRRRISARLVPPAPMFPLWVTAPTFV
ncbi:MAG: hypothetical protein E7609_04645 [Ruminococcaceae bacterium]|nr:hypothetical protein [Oscillospiraceae bacterium]